MRWRTTLARGVRRSVAGILIAAAVVASCSSSPAAPSQQADTPPRVSGPADGRVLFIGNSLTQANDLPAMVETLSRQGGTPISTVTVAFGGFGLGDHWN